MKRLGSLATFASPSAAILFGAVALHQPLAANATQPPVLHDTSVKSGFPKHIVAPVYPREALAQGQTGHVDIDAVVTTEERLSSLRYTADGKLPRSSYRP